MRSFAETEAPTESLSTKSQELLISSPERTGARGLGREFHPIRGCPHLSALLPPSEH